MFSNQSYLMRALAGFTGLCCLLSCASYNNQASVYYSNLREGQYEKASSSLDNTRLLKKNRNRLLYLLEKGKVCHLLQQWDKSNRYFNEADQVMEATRTSAKDIALGTLVNPMMQQYRGEDFEKYLVHYYKALNYLQLGETEDAMVEARRITLRTNAQADKTANGRKYSEDAFSMMLQGMIYEKSNDANNAFIAYRNAVDLFLEHGGSFYSIALPARLKEDLLRMAYLNGFEDELARYEKIFNTRYDPGISPGGGELILFWENGAAPVKQQEDLYFTMIKDAGGNFIFRDASGLYDNIPFDFARYNGDNTKLTDLRSLHVAWPKYEEQPLVYSGASVQLGDRVFYLEPAENINTLAFETLRQRTLKELSAALTRLAVKKLAEAAIRPDESEKDEKGKSEEEKKKEKKEKNQREAIALGLQLLNFATEKADTRNWQSLPHTIYYTRVPLKKGQNDLTLQLNGGSSPSMKISIEGNGTLQFRNICTLQ